MRNLAFIKENGLKSFIGRQKKRIRLLERMIHSFDDGRSRSFFCKAACLRDPTDLESALNEAMQRIKTDHIKPDDMKAKAKMLRAILSQGA